MAKTTFKKKKKPEFTIEKKRSGRFCVKNSAGKYINGDDKVEILLKEGKIKKQVAKKKPE